MNLERHQIILGKVKGLAVVLIVSTSMASTATAQIVPPLAEGLIEETVTGSVVFLWVMARESQITCALKH